MCTLFYIPIQKDRFILAHCRDERESRPQAVKPDIIEFDGQQVLAPMDPQGGGTWFCMDQSRIVCILNGAFEKHNHKPPYKHSRGLVIRHLYDYDKVSDFLKAYDFEGIEPFTMIVVEKRKIYEIRWDGEVLFTATPDNCESHIYSSSTLYNKQKRGMRKEWFDQWLFSFKFPNTDDLEKFIMDSNNVDPEYGYVMRRPDVSNTVSISLVDFSPDGGSLKYIDLIDKSVTNKRII